MSRSKIGVVVAAAAVVVSLVLASASATSTNQAGPIYFGMDAPLTGPTQLVGQSDRQAVEAVVAYWNARGGIKGGNLPSTFDNSSNPSQADAERAEVHQRLEVHQHLGSGNAAAAVATGAIASQARMPFITLSAPPTQLVEPPQPYVYILSATARLYAYSEAAYLRKLGIKRVWLMGDNGKFRPGTARRRSASSQRSTASKSWTPRSFRGVHGLLRRADKDQRTPAPRRYGSGRRRPPGQRSSSSSSSFSYRNGSSSRARTSRRSSCRGRAGT